MILISFAVTETPGQTENYYVRRATFSSDEYDEFSPVYYKEGVVFCSNRNPQLFTGYYTSRKKPFFRLYYADTTGNTRWNETKLLPGEINSNLNNGPATFNKTGDTVYFSRNLIVKGNIKDISGPGNKLGLFSAVFRNGEWTDMKELRFNDNAWNVTTPFLSPDGKKLFFASDKAEGYGGSDIYFSQWKNGYWDNPVNLGENVNTEGNEAYPFINSEGDMFFSSDRHPGKGGKDIFYTRYADSAWIRPVALSAPINSEGDDFGFITDDTFSEGYFSSDRGEMLDIYYFRTVFPEFLYCEVQSENRYCYTFTDDASIDIDPLSLEFAWTFDDDTREKGYSIHHCFPGTGTYSVKQDIVDRKSGRIVFNKFTAEVEVRHSGLPYIISPDIAEPGRQVSFKAESDIKGFEHMAFYWNFGNSDSRTGPEVNYTFRDSGIIPVRLMTVIRDTSDGRVKQACIMKPVTIRSSDKNGYKSPDLSPMHESNSKNIHFNNIYSAGDEISDKAIFAVQIMISKDDISTDDIIFSRLGPGYPIRKIWLDEENAYSYVIDEQLNFMAAYPAYREAASFGFRNALIRTYVPADPGETELWNFKRTYDLSSGKIFMNNTSSLSPEAIPMLERLVLLLKRNPGMKIMIIAHTENTGNTITDMELSVKQAKSILDYLVKQEISSDRLSSAGYGGTKPVAPQYPESERIRNRRVDFIFMNDR